MSKILLIYPPINALVPAKSTLLGLGYLASVLRNKGHEVIMKDLCLSNPEITFKFNVIPDVVGISSMFTEYKLNVFDMINAFKKWLPNTIQYIVGGAHASTFPEEMIEYADTVVVGEGEEVICDIVENRRKGIIIAERIRNLDNLPMPAWDLMMPDIKEMNRLSRKSPFLMRQPLVHIITSRGCPNNCTFCSVKVQWGRQWIARSAKNVVDEIEYLYRRGYREIHFNDDNCSVDRGRMYGICDEILQRALKVKIACPTGIHIGTLDKPLLKQMKKVGFYRLCFGIETGNQEMQVKIKKNINLDKAQQVIKDANDLGFWTSATFINHFPFATREVTAENLLFAYNSELDFPIFYTLNIQPKTEIAEELKRLNIEFTTDNFGKGTIDYFYQKFIGWTIKNPFTIIKLIKKIHSFEDLRYALGLIWFALTKIIFKKAITNETVRGR